MTAVLLVPVVNCKPEPQHWTVCMVFHWIRNTVHSCAVTAFVYSTVHDIYSTHNRNSIQTTVQYSTYGQHMNGVVLSFW
jgi:hypothetical protein